MGNKCSSCFKSIKTTCSKSCNCCGCCDNEPSSYEPKHSWKKEDNDEDKETKPANGFVKPDLPTEPLPKLLPSFPEKSDRDVLTVEDVNLNYHENGQLHNTSKYELMTNVENPNLVIRRGQDFFINIHFNRKFDKTIDGLSFVLSVSDGKANLSHGTLIVLPLLSEDSRASSASLPLDWSAHVDSANENDLRVQIKPSTRCPVGKWNLEIDTRLKRGKGLENEPIALSYKVKNPIYILFNPWCKEDQVYLDDPASRQEYVLEETGLIWRGSHNRLRPTPWAYSQFDKDVLDCALHLLSGPGRLSPPTRADPVKISRAISAAVNSPDDNGLLQGNWSDNFDGGVPPTTWTGSLKIIQNYFSSKSPVKFGQCWVFAGALTTIARTLGIPCRPVTNYSSAHDTHSSLTIDYFFDDKGKQVDALNEDSIWNFHVWNEVWMTRPDLDNNLNVHSGWQVIDSTPQEKSDDMYRCGPASVKAVKEGNILKSYDGAFVFSEVNADKVYWLHRRPGAPLKLLGKKSEGIGMHISTKAIGKFEREDITHQYKYPEQSTKEREALLNALRMSESELSRYYLNEDFNDIHCDFDLIDDIVIGSPFRVRLNILNKNQDTDHNVSLTLRVDAMHYTGKVKEEVKEKSYDKYIPRGSYEEVEMLITYADYASKLCGQCDFNVACLVDVKETKYDYFAQDTFRVRKPDIKFKIPEEKKNSIAIGESFCGTLSLPNPLPIPLTKCRFLLETPGLGDPVKIKLKETVHPGDTAEAEFELVAQADGEKTLTAKFYSMELNDVDGFTTIIVQPGN